MPKVRYLRGAWMLGVTLLSAVCALGVTLDTGDGLQVTFSDADGSISGVTSGGAAVPLIVGQGGGLVIQPGRLIAPSSLAHLDFNTDSAGWTTARNANWDNAGAYAAWNANGGIGDTGHLLLGDGATAGSGMASPARSRSLADRGSRFRGRPG